MTLNKTTIIIYNYKTRNNIYNKDVNNLITVMHSVCMACVQKMPRKNKPMSNAERHRRFREKLLASPTKHDTYLEREKKRWHDRRAAKKLKGIDDIGEREQRRKRRQLLAHL